MKSWFTKKDRLLAGTILAGASVVGLAGPAMAQDEAGSADEEIVVTGSRIPAPQLTSVNPVQQVTAEEISTRGVTRIEDMINQLPQAIAAQSSSVGNAASGTATVDLRSLGAQRTLVLVDGRRLMPGDPFSSAPDVNAIPSALVERIEVLTGGASAVYGADAVAGVANFIMMDDFEGVRFDGQYSFFQSDNSNDEIGNLAAREATNPRFFRVPDDNVVDGETVDFSAIFGASTEDGRGNVTAYASYRNIKQILQGSRGFSACAFSSSTSPALICGGSSTGFPTRIQAATQAGADSVETGGAVVPTAGGGIAPFGQANQFNFAPDNPYQRPDERYSLGAFAHYEVNPHVDLYTQLMFMDDRSTAQIAASGIFRFAGLTSLGGLFQVNCDNPFLSPDLVNHICTSQGLGGTDVAIVSLAHRNVNGAPRQDDLRHTSYRAVLGARGELVEGWSYDMYGQYGTVLFQDNYRNEMSLRRVNNALINVGGECGINVDADPSNDDPGCTPLNVFTADGPTPDQLAYVVTPGFQMGSTKQQVFNASVTGDLGVHGIKSPFAEEGIGLAFGTEYRSEESELRTDTLFCPSTAPGTVADLMGQGSATCPVAGGYDVLEFFGEARIPLIEDVPVFHRLGLELAYRYSDYSTGSQTDTYKVGGDWAPTEDIRFRGGYNRAVRSPNIVELFRPTAVGLDGTTDPCAGAAPTASAADCALTGVLPGQYGFIAESPANQYNGLLGGNTDLEPEVADTVTVGFVFTPTFLSGFSLAVDWYNIKLEERIGGIGADNIIDICLTTGDPTFCGLIHRAPISGQLWGPATAFVDDRTVNAGTIETTGIDIEGNYNVDFADWGMEGAGGLAINFVGSYLDEYTATAPGGTPRECAGVYGPLCAGVVGGFGNPLPDWRHKLRVTWETPWSGLELSGSWRHINEVPLEDADTSILVTDLLLGSRDYFDFVGTVDIRDNVRFRAGVNNAFDEDPPLNGGSSCPTGPCNGNTWPGLYDATGRYVFFGITADF